MINKKKFRFAISPDGSMAAFPERQNDRDVLMIVALAGGRTVKTFEYADRGGRLVDLKWSPEGKDLAYILANDDSDSKVIWFQPLDGATPRQIAAWGTKAYRFRLRPCSRRQKLRRHPGRLAPRRGPAAGPEIKPACRDRARSPSDNDPKPGIVPPILPFDFQQNTRRIEPDTALLARNKLQNLTNEPRAFTKRMGFGLNFAIIKRFVKTGCATSFTNPRIVTW